MTSTQKLVAALTAAKAPQELIDRAAREEFNDYKSQSATPCVDLVNTLLREIFNASKANNAALALALTDIYDEAKNGAFDATLEESDAWAESMKDDPEVGPLMRELGLDKRVTKKTE